jgi:protein TonB
MAYAATTNPNRRVAVLGAVATLHAVAGYLLVTGLAASFVQTIRPPLVANTIPLDPLPPSPPPPAPPTKDAARPLDPFTAPTTSVTLAPPSEGVVVTLPTLPPFSDGGIGDAVFPTATPSASPSFSASGPRPRGRQGDWVTANDYPGTDLRLEHAGITRVRLTVGSDGRVTDCAVTASSGWPSLDAAACAKLTQRARFEPATDTTGARVSGGFATAVKWEIPE